MMKKVLISTIILLIIILSTTIVLATENIELNTVNNETTSKVMNIKNGMQQGIDEYVKEYESETYGMVAYILNIIRIYSIPFCFVGIAVGGIYQYAIGTRRLDMKQKGFALILSFVTILVICQVLPLIFVVVVKGWRG